MEARMEAIVENVQKQYQESVKDIFKLGATTKASINNITAVIRKMVNSETNFEYTSDETETDDEDA